MRLISAEPEAPTLQSVALIGIDAELAGYLEQRLRGRWPRLRVQRVACVGELDAEPPQLCIHAAEPQAPLQRPTLWLADIDRSRRPMRISAYLWKSATPMTGRRLLRVVEGMLRADPAGNAARAHSPG